jgi:hypothetical protein
MAASPHIPGRHPLRRALLAWAGLVNQLWWRGRIKQEGFDSIGAAYAGNLLEVHNKPANVHNVEWTTRSAIDFLYLHSGFPRKSIRPPPNHTSALIVSREFRICGTKDHCP